MDKRYHNSWDKENFYYHRTDPKPWIPLEDIDEDRWKFKGWALFIIVGLIVSLTLCFSTRVIADVLAHTTNNVGGKIVITDNKCVKASGRVAYSTNPSGETIFGCWVNDSSFIHILWNGATNPNSYPYTGWETANKQSPTM
jgi:hypothetical protein